MPVKLVKMSIQTSGLRKDIIILYRSCTIIMYNGISLSLALNDPELLMLKYVKALRVYAGDHRALGRSQMCDKIK